MTSSVALPTRHLWRTQDLRESSTWYRQATLELVDELQQIAAWAGGNLDAITPKALQNFATPSIDELVTWIRWEIGPQGFGVAKLHGLPTDAHFLAAISLVLGSSVGTILENYGRIYDVYDRGGCYKNQAIPVSQTRHPTGFHTDSARRETVPDVITLTCVRDGIGGNTHLVSAAKSYHRLVAERPEFIELLHESYVRAVVTPGTEPTPEALIANQFPIFELGPGGDGLTFRYMRYWIEQGQTLAGAPIDGQTTAALDWLDTTLSDPTHYHEQHLNPGDIVWIANRDIAHARSLYENRPQKTRLLYRMWLRN